MGIHFHSFCLLLYLCHVWDDAAFWLTIFKKKIVWRKRISESISGVLAMKNGRLRYFWMIFTRMIESSVKNLKTLDNGLNLGLLRSQKNPENLQEFPSQDFSKFLEIVEISQHFTDSSRTLGYLLIPRSKKPKIIESLSEIRISFKMTNSHRKNLNPEWKFYYNLLEIIEFCLENFTEKCRRVGLQFENTKWHSHKT